MRRLTAEEIETGRSPRGGWTAAQLAEWGVPWPPPKGWRQRLLKDNGREAGPPKPILIGKTGGPVVDDNEEYPPWENRKSAA